MTGGQEHPRLRPVRSFVRREGRMTDGQKRALQDLMARYGLDGDGPALDLPAVFGRLAPVTLEIGFGNGESLLEMARRAPEQDFLGIEVHRPGVGHLLARVEELALENLRVICHDGVEVLRHRIASRSLDGVQLYFPDPWHKKRHHKRRIVQPEWLRLVADRLKPGGRLHMATDWQDYAEHMLALADAEPALVNCAGPGCFMPDRAGRPETKFERRGLARGHGVWDLVYSKA
ncbi:tRNA (guanosine(46)-N7)-methyltransferase TrmB [Methylonatrum kenyense]|uniref:tRNA (guanosine(46)-N7)-methyltransferase TrmB n=1 Tax=Methylonatrum kenyense TaxID=455253 RepID=UPI0020C1817D|nr:tRNA (guanosine(46)-N7)-methyltransferase TrmB [Methylonatrum kenyense]MCK8516704.1 tRNA (guanosine(46)-N7)-methyltransferase TrmB [Methylonatrum kenyense]